MDKPLDVVPEFCPECDVPMHGDRCRHCGFERNPNARVEALTLARAHVARHKTRNAPAPPKPRKQIDRTEWATGSDITLAVCSRCGLERPTLDLGDDTPICRTCYTHPKGEA